VGKWYGNTSSQIIEDLKTLTVMIAVVWDMPILIVMEQHQHAGEAYCLH
jgi:hypothetical protein